MTGWIFEELENWLREKWAAVWDAVVAPFLPYLVLIEWGLIFLALLVFLMALGLLLPFDWFKKARAIIIALGISFMTGAVLMFREMAKTKKRK